MRRAILAGAAGWAAIMALAWWMAARRIALCPWEMGAGGISAQDAGCLIRTTATRDASLVGGLVVLLPVAMVLLSRRPGVVATGGVVLAALLVVLLVLMNGDYAPWPLLVVVLASVMAVGGVVAAVRGRSAREPGRVEAVGR